MTTAFRLHVLAATRAVLLLWLVVFMGACSPEQPGERPGASQTDESQTQAEQDAATTDASEAGERRPHSSVARSVAQTVTGGISPAGRIVVDRLITSGPVIWGGVIVTGTADGRLVAHELSSDHAFATGTTVAWERAFDEAIAGLAVDAASLYAAAGSTLHRLSPVTGEDLWQTDAGSPVVTGMTATRVALYAGLASGEVVSYALEDGSERWRRTLDGVPVDRLVVGEGLVYVADDAGTLVAIEAASGAESWSHEADGPYVGGPAFGGGRVAAVTADGIVSVLAADGGLRSQWTVEAAPFIVAPAWDENSLILTDGAGGVFAYSTNGEPRWSASLTAHLAGTPARIGGVLVASEATGGMVTIDLRNGREIGRVALGGQPAGEAAFMDGIVFQALDDGSVRAFGVDAERREVPLFTAEGSWVLPESGTFRLRDRRVALSMRSERDAVFEISVASAPAEDLVLEVIGDDGVTVATNMGKVVLSSTLRVAMDAGVSYEFEITRPEAAGEVTISIRTEQLQ
ncbi:MAG: PQQ-binding-like beta-propeller repeat protein [Spirochaetota bacterium]